jgi:uncharacterized protein DUF29
MMATSQAEALALLYEQDETAWLEAMAELLAHRRCEELDYLHLSEYLTDMAERDRREVFSRLVVLLTHLLKWQVQRDNRTAIRAQRRELRQLLESGTLRNHALAVLADTYAEARRQAADETELPLDRFAEKCAWDLDELLSEDLPP